MSSALPDADQDAGSRFGACTHCGRPMTEEEQHYYGTACDRCESEMHFAMQDDRDPVLPPPATEDDRLRSEIATLRSRATAAEDKLKDREAEVERLREALTPFAAVCGAEQMKYVRDEQVLELATRAEVPVSEKLRGMHFRAARAALASTEPHARSEEATDAR